MVKASHTEASADLELKYLESHFEYWRFSLWKKLGAATPVPFLGDRFLLYKKAENLKPQFERSRSRTNIHSNQPRAPVAKELSYESETHSSTTRSKAVSKKEVYNTEGNRDKGSGQGSTKTESIPEVEALLARLRAL